MHKFERFECFSQHGRKTIDQPTLMNEDGLVVTHNLFAVIDGATDRKGHLLNGLTSGAFLAEYLQRHLTHIAQDPAYADTEASLLLAGLNRAFGEMMAKEYPEAIADGIEFGPAAAVALVKLHQDGTYSYAIVSDCAFIEMGTHGEVFICPEAEKPYHIERERMDHIQQLMHAQDISLDEAWQLDEAKQRYNAFRKLLNVDWPVFNGDTRLEGLMLHGRRPLENVAALVMMSDGMLLPGATELEGAEMAARQMLAHGISAYANGLKKLYDDDHTREKFFRFKHQDDATALLMQFKPMLKN